MNLRILTYFLTVAREKNITKAAEILHITQPTLSRQLRQLEEEMGVELFERTQNKISLTPAGNLLVHRGKDILEMVERTELEIKDTDTNLSGHICFGAGELNAVSTLGKIIDAFQNKYPAVTFDLFTNTTDIIQERMEKGLIDIALALEPVDMSNYYYIALPEKEIMGVYMSKDAPLARKEKITSADLIGQRIMMPTRLQVNSQIFNWLSGNIAQIKIVGSCDLVGNSVMLTQSNNYYKFGVRFAAVLENQICFRPMEPPLESRVYLVWRRNASQSLTVQKFIKFTRCFLSME